MNQEWSDTITIEMGEIEVCGPAIRVKRKFEPDWWPWKKYRAITYSDISEILEEHIDDR